MNQWKEQFTQKFGVVRDASRKRFDQLSVETITPLFEEFRDFTRSLGFQPEAPVSSEGVRSFKFGLAENAYMLLTFRLDGWRHCVATADFFVSTGPKPEPINAKVELGEANAAWVKARFQEPLDRFTDAFVGSMAGSSEFEPELISG